MLTILANKMSDLRGAVTLLWKVRPIQRKSTSVILKLGPTGHCRIHTESTTSLRGAATLQRKPTSVLLKLGHRIHTGSTSSFIYQPFSHYSRHSRERFPQKGIATYWLLSSLNLFNWLKKKGKTKKSKDLSFNEPSCPTTPQSTVKSKALNR